MMKLFSTIKKHAVHSKASDCSNGGFAMLFTVLIVSLILTIAISISNITFKQTLLSSLAKDSQIAFYQADAGVECALYYDIKQGLFPLGSTVATVPNSLMCADTTLVLDASDSSTDYFVYKKDILSSVSPCFLIVFDKATDPTKTIIQSRGNNMCAAGLRQVERALQVTY